MTPIGKPSGAPLANFDSIPWGKAQKIVRRLQMRIAKARKSGKTARVKALQWTLTHSFYAKALAVKRITSNKGKNTPGVDGVTLNTSGKKMRMVLSLKRRGYKPLPLRRVYIPKANGSKRPLGIPTMKDRSMQALYLLALEPAAEVTADPNSYGFRRHRRCADAIAQCFIALARTSSSVWVLEGDIRACFENISHQWMLENIPLDKRLLKLWLEAGVMKEGKLFPTSRGTPQGGIISPTLANMVLDGLESVAKSAGKRNSKIHVIRYADDFVITGKNQEILGEVRKAIMEFLEPRGLSLHPEKTSITHIDVGLTFLGQHLRKYSGKLLIKPDRLAARSYLIRAKRIIRVLCNNDLPAMVRKLNSLCRGWGYYHRHVVASRVFSRLDTIVFRNLFRRMFKFHSNKGKDWVYRKYWGSGISPVFRATDRRTKKSYYLVMLCSLGIRRHLKIRRDAIPFLPEYFEYLSRRRASSCLL
jgi:RNA-directed DNA polymerase